MRTSRASRSTGYLPQKGTPKPVVDKLSEVIRQALSKPNVVAQLASLGSEARGNTPAEFREFLLMETSKWADVMKQANIKVK
jgi:tripartite-type tricarboxylate transporter receptor subunit TctC